MVVGMFSGKFTSPPISLNLGANGLNFQRADILVHGLDQSGDSFEGRVFLNNPEANAETPADAAHGYAGSFGVYGYGIWPGVTDETPGVAPPRPDTIRAPIDKDLIATEAVRAAAVTGPEVTVTIVPVYLRDPVVPADDAMRLESVSIEIHP
jgi:hypothetical protein